MEILVLTNESIPDHLPDEYVVWEYFVHVKCMIIQCCWISRNWFRFALKRYAFLSLSILSSRNQENL